MDPLLLFDALKFYQLRFLLTPLNFMVLAALAIAEAQKASFLLMQKYQT
jgi:hypothetical protein